MTLALALATLAFADGLCCGFRVSAGRNGLLEKGKYYVHAVARAALAALAVIAGNALLTLVLCETSPDPMGNWAYFLIAARLLVMVYGAFATIVFFAFGFYFAPIGDFRVLTNVLVFGPLTLMRRAVIAGGMLFAVWRVPDWRVTFVAASATISMLGFEALVGRRYANDWRSIVRNAASDVSHDKLNA